ncbi:Ganglioside-induced differentiation-associated protein 1-like [Homarus americanus]|uniref:Ganglioside-induced differentiation-associated protein 1-like n=1 Tax=Homarus americanus TaxID=6706 RepID=A0A8J5K1I7_HOMAM|nr:Ganglioside-induced differentiation-associated protein 1-like [Homarus americanus]
MTSENNENGNGNTLKYFYWYTSFYSQRALMALYEKRVPFKTQIVSLLAEEQYEPWFLKLNPCAEVPVLTDGVKVIPDSTRIIEYLEDNFSNGQFGQLTPKEKGSEESKNIEKFRDLLEPLPVPPLTFGIAAHPELTDNPKPPFTPFILKRMREITKNRPAIIREHAEKSAEFREVLMKKAAEAEQGALSINKTREEMDAVLQEFDAALQKAQVNSLTDKSEWWLCGELFSIADIDLAILLNRINQLGCEQRFWAGGKRPFLEAYWNKMQKRDSFKRATYFSANAMRFSKLRGTLKQSKTFLASLTAAMGIALLSYIVYRRVLKS